MIEECCLKMLKDLNQYKRSKEDLTLFYVNERLNKSLESYIEDITKSEKYLNNRKELNLLRKINKAYD